MSTPMVAAVYARKSPDHNGAALEEARSVKRQIEHASLYAARRGWTIAEEHIYSDDQITGALFGDKRPGLARLLNALSPRPQFSMLVMMEESRLGRESIETAWTLKQITDAGVRVFFYLADQERTLDSATDKVMFSLSAFAAEMEREKARQRTHDALLRKARAGHVAGGSVFGYRNQPVFDGARRSHVERAIEPTEAAVVRRIFEMASAGGGFKRIAATLNEEAVPAPLPRRAGRPRGWAPSTIREMLYRDTYRGVLVWNRSQKVIRRGAKCQRQRPADDWLRVEAPALRIISDEVWTAVHDRLAASRATYLHSTNGHAHGRPANGIESPYLLTGLASCAECGGGMFVHTRHHGRQRVPFFGCSTYHLRGRAICANNLEVPLDATDRAVLDALERDLLRVEVVETALAKALDSLRPSDVMASKAPALREELARLDAEVGRLAGAIAAGGELSALLAALQERERARQHLRVQLAALDRIADRPEFDRHRVLDDLRRLLTDWQGLLRREAPRARPALSALLAGRLQFAPKGEGSGRYYEFSGPGTLGKVVAGLALPTAVVAPTGFVRLGPSKFGDSSRPRDRIA